MSAPAITPIPARTRANNALKHGLTSANFLVCNEEELALLAEIRAGFETALQPEGALEMCAVEQIANAAFRLEKIQRILQQTAADRKEDPFATAETAAMIKQLSRYRATEEMNLHRGYKLIQELQTRRAARMAQLSRNEEWFVPPQVEPRIFANADTDFDLRQRVLAQSNIFGAYATTEPRHDELGYTYWVELPKREQNRRQREAQRKFVEVEQGFVDYLKKHHPSIFDKPAADAPKPADPQPAAEPK